MHAEHCNRTKRFARPLALLITALLASCGGQAPSPASQAEFELLETRIGDIHAAIQSGQLTTVDLVNQYLARIKAYNGTCVSQSDGILGVVEPIARAGQINALQTLNLRPEKRATWGFDERKARSMTDPVDADPNMPDALEVAAELDRKFKETGKLVGPLHGVVLAIKDQYDTFDLRTTSGADAFFANDRPPDDATFIKRLREAGAIILAKSNLGEFASGIPRSAFGGTFCNPYDTERTPGGSSSGSGSAVGANLVTCAIAEETGMSIRGPAYHNSSVGVSPTQELVSRDGMIQQGVNTRVGPICRNVEDTARILSVIAGYDPKDEMTAFAVGRMPEQPYESYARETRLQGVRIGIVREYMSKTQFTAEDTQAIDLVSQAAVDLGKLGATIVDPGAEGALLDDCVRRYSPALFDKQFTREASELFPRNANGTPKGDHISKLVGLAQDTALVPKEINFRAMSGAQTPGQGRYWLDRYLAERGDANIKTTADLLTKANYYQDAKFPDHKAGHQRDVEQTELDMTARMHNRFAVQTIVLQCMAEMELDALMYPTGNMPPPKLGAPRGKEANGRPADGVWRFLGRNGFPVITVPAGFTTETYDWVRTGEGDEAQLVGPTPAKLPIGVDFVARPFDEAMLFRIASAYEAATKHRVPPADFGPVSNIEPKATTSAAPAAGAEGEHES